jgi:cell division cycle 14
VLVQVLGKGGLTQILDCLRGLQYAMRLGWFDYKKFDIAEYEHYEKI